MIMIVLIKLETRSVWLNGGPRILELEDDTCENAIAECDGTGTKIAVIVNLVEDVNGIALPWKKTLMQSS